MTKQTLQKISAIHKKIELLQQQQTKLTTNLEIKIIALLKKEKAFENDFEVLYGAIYELTQKLKKADVSADADSHNRNSDHPSATEIANWRILGKSILEKSTRTTASPKST